MNKKTFRRKLNNQKGITAADSVISMLIVLITLGVIAMAYTNLVLTSRGTDRRAGATRIATNILENIGQVYFDEIQGKETDDRIYNTNIPAGYQAVVEIDEENDLEKSVTVKVNYTVGTNEENNQKEVSLSKKFYREIINECNEPMFTEEYLREITGELYSTGKTNYTGGVICPVKYTNNGYQLLSKEKIYDESGKQKIWYSYSSKQWARILVLDNTELTTCLETSGEIAKFLRDDTKSFLWVPNYGISANETFFKYRDTEHKIEHTVDGDLFYYFIGQEQNDLSSTTSHSCGEWVRYSDLTNPSSSAFQLNNYQCGPVLEY